jgi:hypothetical protein
MTNHEFEGQLSPEERLVYAKAVFRGSVLQNDTLFDVLQAHLGVSSSMDVDLPDFGLEPTLKRNDDGTSTIGLRINRTATTKGGVISAYIGVYDYLPLGYIDSTTGDTKVTPELEAALAAACKEKADALGIWQAWQVGVGEMGTQFSEPLTLDPMTDTFELQEQLMARNYVVDSE